MKNCHQTSDKPKTKTIQNVIDDNDYLHLSQKLAEHNSSWKARINQPVKRITPLERAVNHNSYECFDLLIQYGADTNNSNILAGVVYHLCSNNDSRYFDEIYKNNNMDLEFCFREVGKRKYIAMEAIAFDKLLKHSNIKNITVDINTIRGYITTNRIEFVHVLMDKSHGYKIDSNTLGKGLISAISYKKPELVEFFLSCEIDVNAIVDSTYPIFAACQTWNAKIMKLLIDSGADCNLANKSTTNTDYTPLMMLPNYMYQGISNAQKKLALKLAKMLINNGADVNYINSNNLSPLRNAIACHSVTMIEFLIENGAEVQEEDILYMVINHNNNYYQNSNYYTLGIVNILVKNGCSLLYKNDKTCLLLETMNLHNGNNWSYHKYPNLFDLIVDELKKLPLEERTEYLTEYKYHKIIKEIDETKPKNSSYYYYQNYKLVDATENIMFYHKHLVDIIGTIYTNSYKGAVNHLAIYDKQLQDLLKN